YQQRDRQAYEDASQVISTALHFLVSLTQESITEDREVDSVVQAIMALEQVRQLNQFLLMNCLISGHRKFVDALTQQLDE
ncbi:MAG: hypothetical protein GTO45_09790, partial [Candidatus Aminicenantes bacterium]|nr:hypothetical protein [Candidatus Aminicenantes bacterium]NIN18384.1 hypothetical protein [Candidatus Aminicenantes bacterium]NIN42272.1 hypothetical protein [Candidatus Aminicenantes bacterium]NIN85038.1 hypothetical protein [Candidatus Aminicenantes bacterium]NIO81249.1 hypothetical protein [Candidatus Aminicenantes bacterium]